MTLQEKIAYRDAMEEMAIYSPCLFNHYQDEVNRMNNAINAEFMKIDEIIASSLIELM